MKTDMFGLVCIKHIGCDVLVQSNVNSFFLHFGVDGDVDLPSSTEVKYQLTSSEFRDEEF